MTRPFLAIAHRGARACAPENTLPAIRAAQRTGANVVELDVQVSRDGELVVFHDDTILRCSDGLSRFPDHTDYALVEAGVTGIFTDYPNRLAEVVRESGRSVTLRPWFRRRR